MKLRHSKTAPEITANLNESDEERVQRIKQEAREYTIKALDGFATKVSGLIPRAEELSWASKEVAANAWAAGSVNTQQLAMLEAEANITGETIAELVASILTNVMGFYRASGQIAGLRRVTLSAINTAPTEAEVEAALVALNTILEG